ncbi:CBS domain-containing protein [Thermus tengchongensis]|uniref:CBS domain-containing protein n=1 Tax=Thermus tengchongensis TaxID=1214928 RepID=UPI001F0D02A2|nr:CBS domain-containing protein [Thermus tengchongensis]
MEDGTLLGVVTSRDLRGAHPNRVVVDVLQNPPLHISPKASLLEAHALMEERGVERLLVVEEGRLLGILTKRALAFALGQGFYPVIPLRRGRVRPGLPSAPHPSPSPPFRASQALHPGGGKKSGFFLGDSGRKAAQEAAGEPQSHRRRSHSPGQLGLYPGQGSTRKDSPGGRGDPG